MSGILRVAALVSMVALVAACKSNARAVPEDDEPRVQTAAAPSASAAGDDGARAEAARVYGDRCAACHGAQGRGDGTIAASLRPKPRDYRDAAWQKTVTDDQLRDAILRGGQALGKSALMPANPDLEGRPRVVDELVAKIRAFGR